MLEDASIVRDRSAVANLFEDGALLVASNRREQARGSNEITRFAAALWKAGQAYVAEPGPVLQARDTALVVRAGGINVVRRGGDGAWRYAIALLTNDQAPTKEERR